MIRIGLLGPDDAPELFAAFERSRTLHGPWITPPASEAELRGVLAAPPETRLSYGIRVEDGNLAGVVNINSIIRGAFQNGFLGYYALSPYERHGNVREGMIAVLARAFGEHELHRVEANIQPANERSIRLIRSLGFRLEGHSPRYLKIGEEWRDHDRYAMTVEDWMTLDRHTRALAPTAEDPTAGSFE
jgi:ribosomal-protein-alanine N-acetyltransferase